MDMEWTTALFKTNHHFLKSRSADHDARDDQSAAPLSVFRRSDPALDLSSEDNSAAAAAVAAATARRTVSISRSGRYKSKTKQRVRLFNNGGGPDVAANNTAAAAAVTRTSPAAVDPSTATSDAQPRHAVRRHDQAVRSPSTNVETGKCDDGASKVEELATTTSIIAADHCQAHQPAESSSSSSSSTYRMTAAPSHTNELSIAELDESTDL